MWTVLFAIMWMVSSNISVPLNCYLKVYSRCYDAPDISPTLNEHLRACFGIKYTHVVIRRIKREHLDRGTNMLTLKCLRRPCNVCSMYSFRYVCFVISFPRINHDLLCHCTTHLGSTHHSLNYYVTFHIVNCLLQLSQY